jgi:hypothetical protein
MCYMPRLFITDTPHTVYTKLNVFVVIRTPKTPTYSENKKKWTSQSTLWG